ncbi:MAG: diphthine--ammonia ligase [Desulfobacterota bacterium]|nr:diphthine--ammonia ligase [Thermodesulfobacteriota bacterium]MDW8002847.1 diphthine--ammonia ligase [Deltaproteobacteria bacterium]
MRAFSSWSGGKDSSLALYLAKKSGIECLYLLNMIGEDEEFTRSHGLPKDYIRMQASAIGIELLQVSTSWEEYEKKYKWALKKLKNQGIEAGVFGDIDLEEHKEWVERVCKEVDIVPFLPLWKMERKKVIETFIAEGFRAILCATKIEELVPYLGREIDESFLREIEEKSVDPCGEGGEFHTFVYDGPIFRRPIRIKKNDVVLRRGSYVLRFDAVLS